MARASGSPLILVILVITSFRLQKVVGKLNIPHARGHSGNLAYHLLELINQLLIRSSLGPLRLLKNR